MLRTEKWVVKGRPRAGAPRELLAGAAQATGEGRHGLRQLWRAPGLQTGRQLTPRGATGVWVGRRGLALLPVLSARPMETTTQGPAVPSQ